MSSNTCGKDKKINNLRFFEIPPIRLPLIMNQDKLVTPSAPISMTEIIVLFKSGLQSVEASHSWFHSLQTNHTKGSPTACGDCGMNRNPG